jgi:NDP-sugar pyrophosphorylase family protein
MSLPALVLTAGLGTRMRPLSDVRAKPAMPVADEPLVCRILQRLASGGVARAVLNLHHLPHTITAAVGDGAFLGLQVRYSWENPVLGSAGGPRRALPLLDADRFLIVNGDTLTDVDLSSVAREHERSSALVTLSVIPNPAPERYGGVVVDEAGCVTAFVPRGTPGPSWHFVGVQVVEAAAFAGVSPDHPSESIAALYPALMRERPGSVRAFRTEAAFFDIGTPEDYLATSLAVAASERGEHRLLGRGCRVSPTARLSRTILWDHVTVGDDAVLTDCVVADGASVPDGLHLEGCAIVPAAAGRPGPRDETIGHLRVSRIRAGPRRKE